MTAPTFKLRYVLAVSFIGWTVVALFYLAQSLARGADVSSMGVATLFGSVWLWALFSPAIVAITARLPLERQRLRTALGHLVCAVCFAVADVAIDTPIYAAFGSDRGFVDLLVDEWRINVFSYVCVAVAGYAAIHYQAAVLHRSRAQELQRQFLAARLDVLTAKLRPHFFFNALHSIASLIRLDKRDEALGAICGLGDLLRATLAVGATESVSLDTELSWVEQYLQIEHIRYQERLTIEVEVSTDARRALVPALLLQPLVENAIQHGVERRTGTSRLRIEANRQNGELRLAVREAGDPAGVGDDTPGFGLGLESTRERLAHLYGNELSGVELTVSDNGSVTQVRLPFQEAS